MGPGCSGRVTVTEDGRASQSGLAGLATHGSMAGDNRLARVKKSWGLIGEEMKSVMRAANAPTSHTTFRITVPARPDALLDDPDVLAANRRDDYMPYWGYLWQAGGPMTAAVLAAEWPSGGTALEIGAARPTQRGGRDVRRSVALEPEKHDVEVAAVRRINHVRHRDHSGGRRDRRKRELDRELGGIGVRRCGTERRALLVFQTQRVGGRDEPGIDAGQRAPIRFVLTVRRAVG